MCDYHIDTSSNNISGVSFVTNATTTSTVISPNVWSRGLINRARMDIYSDTHEIILFKNWRTIGRMILCLLLVSSKSLDAQQKCPRYVTYLFSLSLSLCFVLGKWESALCPMWVCSHVVCTIVLWIFSPVCEQ